MITIPPHLRQKFPLLAGFLARGRGGEGGGEENSRFLNYATEISWEWVRLACPASLEDIAMRFQAKLRNTPPQFGSSRLRGVPCNRAVGTRHETANSVDTVPRNVR